jgi:predicted dienelactone hydrolase
VRIVAKTLIVGLLLLAALAMLLVLGGKPEPTPGIAMATASAPDPGQPPLDLRIWYPDPPLGAGKLPMVVVSHGTGGSAESHIDTAVALAKAGFIVVAVNHTGDNYRDIGAVGKGTHLVARPRHIARTIDYMLARWSRRASIDPEQIGMFGHSAGGFTALVVAGAEPRMWRGADYCRGRPSAWSCRYIERQGLSLEDLGKQRNMNWVHDDRVKAAVIAAPAIGYSLDREALANVQIPVQLWSAERDDVVDDSPATIRSAMSRAPEFHEVANAGHFSFLSPCTAMTRAIIQVMHWFGTEDICADPAGFDRVRFHASFNRDLTAFFNRELTK